MNHVKRLWGYYLVLLLLIAILSLSINWIYTFFQTNFNRKIALIALSFAVMVVTIYTIQGAKHGYRLIRDLMSSGSTNSCPIPLLHKLFKIEQTIKNETGPSIANEGTAMEELRQYVTHPARRHRGKPPRFPEEKIRKAVLKWESRDPSFSTLTLEEFLAQEFGSGPDGILLMATTTFYDWRRRILKEIESHKPQD